jgi:hypothetical protein
MQNILLTKSKNQKSCACNFQIFFFSLFFFKCPIFMFKIASVKHVILFRGKKSIFYDFTFYFHVAFYSFLVEKLEKRINTIESFHDEILIVGLEGAWSVIHLDYEEKVHHEISKFNSSQIPSKEIQL